MSFLFTGLQRLIKIENYIVLFKDTKLIGEDKQITTIGIVGIQRNVIFQENDLQEQDTIQIFTGNENFCINSQRVFQFYGIISRILFPMFQLSWQKINLLVITSFISLFLLFLGRNSKKGHSQFLDGTIAQKLWE